MPLVVKAEGFVCPKTEKECLQNWIKHKDLVRKAGKKHRDYELIFSYMIKEESVKIYYYNQCVNQISKFEHTGDFENFQSWIFCLENYFKSELPDLVKNYKECSLLKDKN